MSRTAVRLLLSSITRGLLVFSRRFQCDLARKVEQFHQGGTEMNDTSTNQLDCCEQCGHKLHDYTRLVLVISFSRSFSLFRRFTRCFLPFPLCSLPFSSRESSDVIVFSSNLQSSQHGHIYRTSWNCWRRSEGSRPSSQGDTHRQILRFRESRAECIQVSIQSIILNNVHNL